ncbi:MAG: SRPBCC family protein [Bacteroidetes bacterium]|nr:SRPBCC family protein [Bacteroidota bacterium]
MTTIESRIGKINCSDEKVYNLLSKFSNFNNFIPHEKVKNYVATEDTCNFTIDKIGDFGMRIIERKPLSLIKIMNDEKVPFNFNFWIQLKKVAENDIRVRLTIKAELNAMLKMVAKKPLTNFVNTLVDKLEEIRI